MFEGNAKFKSDLAFMPSGVLFWLLMLAFYLQFKTKHDLGLTCLSCSLSLLADFFPGDLSVIGFLGDHNCHNCDHLLIGALIFSPHSAGD